jgi:hypothetical protein
VRLSCINRCERRWADIELAEVVIVDFDSIARIAVAEREYLTCLLSKAQYIALLHQRDTYSTHCSKHFFVLRQFGNTLCKCSSCGVVLGFGEVAHGLTQCEHDVRWLQAAMCEVCCELKLSLDICWFGLLNSAPFELNGNTNDIFAADYD